MDSFKSQLWLIEITLDQNANEHLFNEVTKDIAKLDSSPELKYVFVTGFSVGGTESNPMQDDLWNKDSYESGKRLELAKYLPKFYLSASPDFHFDYNNTRIRGLHASLQNLNANRLCVCTQRSLNGTPDPILNYFDKILPKCYSFVAIESGSYKRIAERVASEDPSSSPPPHSSPTSPTHSPLGNSHRLQSISIHGNDSGHLSTCTNDNDDSDNMPRQDTASISSREIHTLFGGYNAASAADDVNKSQDAKHVLVNEEMEGRDKQKQITSKNQNQNQNQKLKQIPFVHTEPAAPEIDSEILRLFKELNEISRHDLYSPSFSSFSSSLSYSFNARSMLKNLIALLKRPDSSLGVEMDNNEKSDEFELFKDTRMNLGVEDEDISFVDDVNRDNNNDDNNGNGNGNGNDSSNLDVYDDDDDDDDVATTEIFELEEYLLNKINGLNQTVDYLKDSISTSKEATELANSMMTTSKQEYGVLEEKIKEEVSKREKAEVEMMKAKEEATQNAKEVEKLKEKLMKMETVRKKSNEIRCYSAEEIATACDNFNEEKKIGGGEFGYVFKGTLDGVNVAIKKLKKEKGKEAIEEMKREASMHGILNHPNVTLLIGLAYEPPCLVYELMENGNLLDKLVNSESQPLLWTKRFEIFENVCCALTNLHSRSPPIVHLDIKPANILLNENLKAKICDVGFARLICNEQDPNKSIIFLSQAFGTLAYMCPVIRECKGYSKAADLYSLGMVLWDLLLGIEKSKESKKVHRRYVDFLIDLQNDSQLDAELRWRSFLDPSAQWPPTLAFRLAQIAKQCTKFDRRKRPPVSHIMNENDSLKEEVEKYVAEGDAKFEIVTPQEFICPLTKNLMSIPVVAADGHTYEMEAIKNWIKTHTTSPFTKRTMKDERLVNNFALKSMISKWKEQNLIFEVNKDMKI